jgi:hypothetical protein
LAWCACVALLGCGDSASDGNGGSPGDGGTDTMDAGAPPVDWMPRDTGPPPSLDAGAGYDDRQCTLLLDVLSGAPTPRCAAETLTCLQDCTGGAEGCDDACYAADPTPPADGIDCNGCTTGLFFDCLIDAGCDSQVNAFLCCFEDDCLGGADNCAEQMCIAELQGIYNCAVANAPSCLDPAASGAACFAPGDEDGGT